MKRRVNTKYYHTTASYTVEIIELPLFVNKVLATPTVS